MDTSPVLVKVKVIRFIQINEIVVKKLKQKDKRYTVNLNDEDFLKYRYDKMDVKQFKWFK